MAVVVRPNKFDCLPPELWPRIFAHLKPRQLLSIRLVCQRWKAVVDRTRSLWDRICIDVPAGVTLGRNFRPVVAPAAGVRLEAVQIKIVKDAWWSSIAERLTFVRMGSCTVSFDSFLEMLRRTPNLTRFELQYMKFVSRKIPEVVDVRLEKLKSLKVVYYTDEILDLFGRQLCPNLHELHLVDAGEENDEATTVRLIESVQDTLERLELWMTPYLLQRISQMKRLQLKSVRPHLWEDADIVRLSRLQPCLEEFTGDIQRNSVLCEIGRNLSGLKRLEVRCEEDSLAFLDTMPLLEKLNIRGALQDWINFNGLKCPNLTELTLNNVKLVTSQLRSFLASTNNLVKLIFLACTLDTWSGLSTILADHPALRQMDVTYVTAEDTSDFSPSIAQSNLEHLKISPAVPFPTKMLLELTRLTPDLKTLALFLMPAVDDATFRKLCHRLPRLTRLTLSGCAVTVACAETLADLRQLEYLRVDDCPALCEAVRKRRGRGVEIVDLSGGRGQGKVQKRKKVTKAKGRKKVR